MNPATPRRPGVHKKVKRPDRPLPPSQLVFVAHKDVVDALAVDENDPVTSEAAKARKAQAQKTVESHAHVNKVLLWQFEAAKAMHGWPQGAELSHEDFLAAIKAVDDIQLR